MMDGHRWKHGPLEIRWSPAAILHLVDLQMNSILNQNSVCLFSTCACKDHLIISAFLISGECSPVPAAI